MDKSGENFLLTARGQTGHYLVGRACYGGLKVQEGLGLVSMKMAGRKRMDGRLCVRGYKQGAEAALLKMLAFFAMCYLG